MEPLSLFPLLTVVGGSGFLGKAVVETFAALGWRVRVVTREPSRAEYLKPLGDLGQIGIFKGNIHQPEAMREALSGATAAINLVGTLDEREQSFAAVAHGAGTVAAATMLEGVEAFVHVSAAGASPDGATAYQRSKAAAEDNVRKVAEGAAIVRPTLIFGPEDQFTNRFGRMAGSARIVPVLYPDVEIQPVYVSNVAKGIAALVARQLDGIYGETYEFAGPQALTMGAFVSKIIAAVGVERLQKTVSPGLARLASCFPGAPITREQIAVMAEGALPSGNHPGLADLDIVPTPFEAVAASWLRRYRPGGRFFNPV